jgi:hypothetical protein
LGKIIVVIGDNGFSANDRRMLYLYVGLKMAFTHLTDLVTKKSILLKSEDFLVWENEFKKILGFCNMPVYSTPLLNKPMQLFRRYRQALARRQAVSCDFYPLHPDWTNEPRLELFEAWIKTIWCAPTIVDVDAIERNNNNNAMIVDSETKEIVQDSGLQQALSNNLMSCAEKEFTERKSTTEFASEMYRNILGNQFMQQQSSNMVRIDTNSYIIKKEVIEEEKQ